MVKVRVFLKIFSSSRGCPKLGWKTQTRWIAAVNSFHRIHLSNVPQNSNFMMGFSPMQWIWGRSMHKIKFGLIFTHIEDRNLLCIKPMLSNYSELMCDGKKRKNSSKEFFQCVQNSGRFLMLNTKIFLIWWKKKLNQFQLQVWQRML